VIFDKCLRTLISLALIVLPNIEVFCKHFNQKSSIPLPTDSTTGVSVVDSGDVIETLCFSDNSVTSEQSESISPLIN